MSEDKYEVTNVNENVLASAESLGFKFTDNFKGGAKPKIQTIRILHPAGMFEVGEKQFKTCKGYILDYHPANAWWEDQSDDSPSAPPNCASSNGVRPDQGDMIQSNACASCERNKFGSDRAGGPGKDCTNMRIVHLFIPGKLFPFRMVLKPSSFETHDEYLTELSAAKIPLQIAKTKFELERHSEGKRQWSIVHFAFDGVAETKAEQLEIKSYLDRFGSLFHMSVTEEDVEEDVQVQQVEQAKAAKPEPDKLKKEPEQKEPEPKPCLSEETKEGIRDVQRGLELDEPAKNEKKSAPVDKEAQDFGFE